MNANELADDMENGIFNDANYNKKKAAEFIRQQQAEIEALKSDGKVCARCGAIAYDPVITQTAKTLTDEEIYEVWCDAIKEEAIVNKGKPPILKYQPFVFFARAILRKAQEK